MISAFWKDLRVFVTGATGLLGGWLVKELLARECEVTALVRDGAPRSLFHREHLHEQVEVVRGDLDDPRLLMRTLSEYGVEVVFHLAAQTLVGVGKADPVGTLESNVRGTWNLLDATRQAGILSMVVASSDKAYGSSEDLPYLETHPLQGRYPYDVSKSCADLISTMYATTYELPVAITRCGNLFGGGDLNFSRTIPGLVKATLRGEPFLIRSDGKYIRDFLYVKDAVLGYLTLAEQLATRDELRGQAFNFSLEERLDVLQIVDRVLGIMGREDLDPIIQNIASAEIREQYMSASKAREVLGWEPTYGLDGGLRETIEWYRGFFAQEVDATHVFGRAFAGA